MALRTDRVQLDNVRLKGRQDRVYLNTSNRENLAETDRIYRVLVKDIFIEGDAGYQGPFKANLGRAWDPGAGKTGYVPRDTANGQALIAQSTIDASYDRLSPWGWAATTARPSRANLAADRNLNDTAWNRLWEWQTEWR